MKISTSIPFLCVLTACAQAPVNDELRAAQIVLQHGGTEAALNVANSELAKNPNNVAALDLQGEAEYSEKRFMQAAASYNKALHIDSSDVKALTGLGRIQLKRDPSAAEKLLRKAVHINPRDTDAKVDLGISLDAQGNYAEAQKLYREVIAQAPESDRAIENLGLSMALDGKPEEALQVLRPLANSDRSSRSTQVNTAFVMILAGHNEEARLILMKSFNAQEADRMFARLSAHARAFN